MIHSHCNTVPPATQTLYIFSPGQHSCLFCNTASEEMNISQKSRQATEQRLLQSLIQDYSRFQAERENKACQGL